MNLHMKLIIITTLWFFSFSVLLGVAQAQCKNEYSGTNTGLACEISTDGKGTITLEDDEGNSTDLNAKKAKRTLGQEERKLKRVRTTTVSLLNKTRRLNPNQTVESSRHAQALTALSVTAGGLGITRANEEAQIRKGDTILESRTKMKTIKSDVNQAIRQNKKTKRLLKNCKKSQCDCGTKTVSASMEFYEGNQPGKQNNCRAFGLAKWSATETNNAKSVEVFYTWTGSGPSLRSQSGTPPYDDTYPFYDTEILAGEGNHQLEITKGSKSHGNPNKSVDCSDMSAEQQQLVINPYVEAEICLVVKKKK